MKLFLCSLIVAGTAILSACPGQPIQNTTYDVIVAAKAFLDNTKTQHPECGNGTQPSSTVCVDLAKATSAKDALIDALEDYCAGPDFTTGTGPCDAPTSGTSTATQLTAKLNAAIASYNQTATDLKGVL